MDEADFRVKTWATQLSRGVRHPIQFRERVLLSGLSRDQSNLSR